MKIKPIKLEPLKFMSKPLIPKDDADFDSLPDHLDCNPRNPLQQDNNKLSITSLIPYKRRTQYIPPGKPSELPGSTFPDTSQAIDAEYTNIQPDDTLPSEKHEEQYQKAKQVYKQTYDKPYILFIQKTDGSWTRTPYKFTDDRLSFQEEAKIQQMLQNPQYINYQLSQDHFFAERKNTRQQQIQAISQRASSYGQNIRRTLQQQTPLTEEQKAYATGPSDLPIQRKRYTQPRRQNPEQLLDTYSRNFPPPKLPDQVTTPPQQSPFYGDSPFPLHVGYYPANPKPVKGDKKRPLFRPPFLRF